jgi:hypothetical protein
MGVIVGSASLLHSLAVRRLGERGAAAKDDESESDWQSKASVPH